MLIAAALLYAAGAITYVYRWRGASRYRSFKQYWRKSWPIFAPLNCVLYMTTRAAARRPVLPADGVHDFRVLRAHWPRIRDEALRLQDEGCFEAAKAEGAPGYYDVGFRTFYKRGWSKYYLKWYGRTHASAERRCPETLALLAQVPGIRGAMFSLLPPGAELSLHADPMACSLRYHLGLCTPNDEACHIDVDATRCTWRDGEDFVFDETYPHRAFNGASEPRLILMCDVDRPLNAFGRAFNGLYRRLAVMTFVPNDAGDGRGAFSALFARLDPLYQWGMALRAQSRPTYRVLKWALNASLTIGMLATAYALLEGVEALTQIDF